jgi:tetraacyldisaccharide 4'-kinase
MHFKNIYLRSFRLFLFPLAYLYGLIIYLRNLLYDRDIIGSVTFNLPIFCVGNLSVGGTGKSPMVEYLANLLKNEYAIATLSRGYKRRTSGYVLANERSTAIEIGDEPMQFHLSHPDIAVAVGEQRIEAIPQLLYDRPETQLIILDDAFQHREINPGFNIILTEYANLYSRDFYLPTGDLRDQKSSARRADIIVVTKCPAVVSDHERFMIMRELNPLPGQEIFFTTIEYNTPYHIVTKEKRCRRKKRFCWYAELPILNPLRSISTRPQKPMMPCFTVIIIFSALMTWGISGSDWMASMMIKKSSSQRKKMQCG